MSDLEVCRYAFEGKINDLTEALRTDPGNAGRTPLHWAASGGNLQLVRLILKEGADVNATDKSGRTPLIIAVSADRVDVANFLVVEGGADVDLCNSTGQCALHYAVSKNRLHLMDILLQRKAKVSVQDWGGCTPLHRSISRGHLEAACKLMAAVRTSSTPSAVVELISLGDSEGNTALHYACEEGNLNAVKLLMEHGALTSWINTTGKTPLDVGPEWLRKNLLNLQ